MSPQALPLKDIHLPEAISWWPLAIGWWVLIITLPFIVFALYRIFQKLNQTKALKNALKIARKNLDQIETNANLTSMQKLREVSALVRRVAISVAPREEVAGLTGKAWLAFLDNGLVDAPFSEGIGRLLVDAPYRKNPPTDPEIMELISLCRNWLKSYAIQKT